MSVNRLEIISAHRIIRFVIKYVQLVTRTLLRINVSRHCNLVVDFNSGDDGFVSTIAVAQLLDEIANE